MTNGKKAGAASAGVRRVLLLATAGLVALGTCWVLVSASTLPPGAATSTSAAPLAIDHAASSYALAYNLGRSLDGAPLTLDEAAFLRGLRAGIAGTAPEVDAAAIPAAIDAAYGREGKERLRAQARERNAAEGSAYLQQLAQAGTHMRLASGVYARIAARGDGAAVQASDTVIVHYVTRTLAGGVIEDTISAQAPIRAPLSSLRPGIAAAALELREGGSGEFVLPPALAYGERGAPPRVRGDATVIAHVQVVSIATARAPPLGAN